MLAIFQFVKNLYAEWKVRRDREAIQRVVEIVDGTRCNICKELYVGLAQDCKCTNWGK